MKRHQLLKLLCEIIATIIEKMISDSSHNAVNHGASSRFDFWASLFSRIIPFNPSE